MKRNLVMSVLWCLLALGANSQENEKSSEKDTVSESKGLSGKLLYGLYKWGEKSDSVSSFSFHFETSSPIDEEEFLLENDSLEIKSIFWGAIRWTEKKENNESKTSNNN